MTLFVNKGIFLSRGGPLLGFCGSGKLIVFKLGRLAMNDVVGRLSSGRVTGGHGVLGGVCSGRHLCCLVGSGF